MEKALADAFMHFYQTLLKPEFDALKAKNEEHDQQFSELLGHMDGIYHRLGRLEDELLMVNNRLNRIEEAVSLGNAKRSDLEKRVNELKSQMEMLQSRLELMERHLETSSK